MTIRSSLCEPPHYLAPKPGPDDPETEPEVDPGDLPDEPPGRELPDENWPEETDPWPDEIPSDRPGEI